MQLRASAMGKVIELPNNEPPEPPVDDLELREYFEHLFRQIHVACAQSPLPLPLTMHAKIMIGAWMLRYAGWALDGLKIRNYP